MNAHIFSPLRIGQHNVGNIDLQQIAISIAKYRAKYQPQFLTPVQSVSLPVTVTYPPVYEFALCASR